MWQIDAVKQFARESGNEEFKIRAAVIEERLSMLGDDYTDEEYDEIREDADTLFIDMQIANG